MLQQKTDASAPRTRWQCLILILAIFPVPLFLSSCGSGAAATPTILVTCADASITVNGQVQCTATITNVSSTLVNWEVNSVAGGNATNGMINTAGLYIAPSSVPSNNVITITAIAQADTSLTGTASITVEPAVAIFGISTVPATTTTVAAGSSIELEALQSVDTAYSNGGINWYVNVGATCPAAIASTNPPPPSNAVLGGNSTLGTFSTNTAVTNYKPPQIPPSGGVVTVTAQSILTTNETYCIELTLTFGNGSLLNGYTFSTRGRVAATNGPFARAGNFTADGNGNLIGGVEDINPQPSGISQTPIQFVGTYNIGPDGRGAMQFCEPSTAPPASCTSPTSFFRISVDSANQAQIIEYSSLSADSAQTVGFGEADSQPTVLCLTTTCLNGTYAFSFDGPSSTTTLESEVGEFSAAGNGSITSGELDVNNAGALSQLQILNTSTYSIAGNGRGTASLVTSGGTFNFSFYLVSASHVKFIETDASPALAGDAFTQQTIAAWGPGALGNSTTFAFETGGTGSSGGIADLVSFTADGAGNVVAESGMLDQNSGGTATSASSLSGTYTIDSSGRGTLSIGGHSYVFYMIATSSPVALIQETTSGTVASGVMDQQQGGAFTTASLSGSYGLSLEGSSAPAPSHVEDSVGQLTSNGAGTVTSGSIDVNNFGATQTTTITTGTYLPTPAGTLRATMLLSPTRSFVLYMVSPTHFLVLDTDATSIGVGSLFNQF